MRYTPYLDGLGITFKDEVSDHAVNIIDHLLELANRDINWGEHEGRKRIVCKEQPLLLVGMPLGQYHCPGCGMMLMAGVRHFDPDDYEMEYQQPWPWGYEEPT